MKWYFAVNANALSRAFYQVKAAVRSCRLNTTLQPHCLVDVTGLDEAGRRKLGWLRHRGVAVIPHRASMLDLLDASPEERELYSGHRLRCDIPQVEREAAFVLYTDIDVLFLSDPPADDIAPPVAACAPEHERGDYSYFNSGVMIINIAGLGELKDDLRDVVARRRASGAAPWDDQGALNELLAGRWTPMEPEWNWKPYWGVNDDARIVHFHGPKPWHADAMLRGESTVGGDYLALFRRNGAGYAHYVNVFKDVMTAY